MNETFVRKINLRSPFRLKRIPLLAQFHRVASKQRVSRKGQFLVTAPLEKLFRWCYRWVRLPASGELEYGGPKGIQAIAFNARNLAFDMFYTDIFGANYEDETAVLLDTFVPSGGCLYDIGSNWGYFTLFAASRGDGIKIHAFEPIPATYADLTRSVQQAGLGNQVKCHNVALSDSDGHMVFQLPFHSASAQAENDGLDIGDRVKVETRKLDSLSLDSPDFLKIDAEGHEASVLRGSSATLTRWKPFVMFENKLYRNAPQETLQPLVLLKELGYRLFVPTLQRRSEETTFFPALRVST